MTDNFDRLIHIVLIFMILASLGMFIREIIIFLAANPTSAHAPTTAAEATQDQLDFCNSTPYEMVGCPTHVPTPTTSAGDPSAYPGIVPVCQPYPWLGDCQESTIFDGLPAEAEEVITPTPVPNPFIGIPRPGRGR